MNADCASFQAGCTDPRALIVALLNEKKRWFLLPAVCGLWLASFVAKRDDDNDDDDDGDDDDDHGHDTVMMMMIMVMIR